MKNMKNTKNILFGTVLGLFFTFGIMGTSCSKWTQPEAEDFYEPPTQSYTDNLGDYQGSPHKLMFGWFGNWAGEGGSMGNTLMGLPDSVDFVSLWLCYGDLNQAQQNDLKAFQNRGGRAYLCWTGRDIGEGLTKDYMTLENGTVLRKEESGLSDRDWRYKFWGVPTVVKYKPAGEPSKPSEPAEDASEEELAAYEEALAAYEEAKAAWDETAKEYFEYRDSLLTSVEAYAQAIVDTCRKYDIDGYDYDMEALGDLCTRSDTSLINTFFRKLIKEFAKDGHHLNIDIPGGTGWLSYYDMISDDVVKGTQYFIWQTYELGHSGLNSFFYSSGSSVRAHKPHLFEEVFKKSIPTATFERAIDKHYFLEQATWVPSFGLEHAGIGAYHIEYDYPDASADEVKELGVPANCDYPHVRKAISIMNPSILK